MLLDEEIRTFEDELQHPIRGKIRDAATLKEILREATQALEKSLEGLPADIRDEAYCLYLQKVRKLMFPFHLAVVSVIAKKKSRKESNREALQALLDWHSEEYDRLAKLYHYL